MTSLRTQRCPLPGYSRRLTALCRKLQFLLFSPRNLSYSVLTLESPNKAKNIPVVLPSASIKI